MIDKFIYLLDEDYLGKASFSFHHLSLKISLQFWVGGTMVYEIIVNSLQLFWSLRV